MERIRLLGDWLVMSKFDVVIPTLNRPEKLALCKESIRKQTFQDFTIYIYEDINNEKAPRIWNRHLNFYPTHSIVFICDDVELDADCFERLLEIDNLEDKLVGFNQKNITDGCQAAMGWCGSLFADRFPNRQVWCPDYDNMHVDGELREGAEALGCFLFASQCKLTHHHPITDVKYFDSTHDKTREHSSEDRATRALRKKKGLTWGLSFERTTERR
jgi:hypothetical protein